MRAIEKLDRLRSTMAVNVLIVSKLGDVCLFWSVVPFFANRSTVSFPVFLHVRGPTERLLSCPVSLS